MSGQEIAALGIVAAAAGWLAVRWRRRGLDDEGRGCHGCPGSRSSEPGRSDNEIVLPTPPGRPGDSGRTRDAGSNEREPLHPR
jgi:hypothetical protein